jgi:hypothetical protein
LIAVESRITQYGARAIDRVFAVFREWIHTARAAGVSPTEIRDFIRLIRGKRAHDTVEEIRTVL